MYQAIAVDLEISLLLRFILDAIVCLMDMCLCNEYFALLRNCMAHILEQSLKQLMNIFLLIASFLVC